MLHLSSFLPISVYVCNVNFILKNLKVKQNFFQSLRTLIWNFSFEEYTLDVSFIVDFLKLIILKENRIVCKNQYIFPTFNVAQGTK